jgi:hypothetical protein
MDIVIKKGPKDSLFEACGNTLKNGKPCQYRKVSGKEFCRRCRDKKRLAEDPVYRELRNSARRRNKRVSQCPKCGSNKAYSSALCAGCRAGGALPWDQVAALYSYQNPQDPLTADEAKRIGDAAMQKMRRALEEEDPMTNVAKALFKLKEDYYG